MKKLIQISAILLFTAIRSFAAGNYTAQWQKATTFYQQTQYDSAAYYFEQVAAPHPLNAELYYNLGNTYYRLNKIPQAVLNYQRALQINPDYKEAKDNLTLTEARISNHIQPAGDIFFIEWWQHLTHPNKTGAYAIASLLVFALIIASMLARRYLKSGSSIPVQLPGLLGFVCVCLLVLAFSSAGRATRSVGAVVMQNDAPLMNSEQKGKPLSLIPEGTTVKITGEKGTWVEVTLPDGRIGWLQQSIIDKI